MSPTPQRHLLLALHGERLQRKTRRRVSLLAEMRTPSVIRASPWWFLANEPPADSQVAR